MSIDSISRDAINKAIITLYGENAVFPSVVGYKDAYTKIRENEIQAKEILLDFDKTHSGELKGENINTILEQARKKRNKDEQISD